MAYANAHVKVTLFGDMFSGNEEWSTGFRMGSEDGGSGNFGIGAGFLDAVAAAWTTCFNSAGGPFSTQYRTLGIKAAVILPTGKTDLANVETYNYATPLLGSAGGAFFPPQIALVAQLAASSPVGLGSKGRMYLPGVNMAVGTNGQIGGTEATQVATRLRNFLDACENATNSPGYVINASQGRPGVPFTAPVNRRVTQVRVGTVYDTQRRRRNNLQETYFGASLVA